MVFVFFMSATRLRPDLLVAGFVLAEVACLLYTGRRLRMPPLSGAIRRMARFGDTVEKSWRFSFTNEALRVLFFVDFFVLGFYVTAAQEGVYAGASVLARLFLLIPLGAAPVYRVKIYRAARSEAKRMITDARRTAARLFSLHAVAGLIILLYFPSVLRTVFRVQGDIPVFFKVFSILLPGLLYFAPAVVMEPAYGIALGEGRLNRISSRVFLLNAFLNLYLIPLAGVTGAAAATSLSLVLYFLWFERELGGELRLPFGTYLLCGAVVYLAYHILGAARLPVYLALPLAVVALPVLFALLGLFEPESGISHQESGGEVVPLEREGESKNGRDPVPSERNGERERLP